MTPDERLGEMRRVHYPCDGCGAQNVHEDDLALLHLRTDLGLCAVRVHRTRECAIKAKANRGGGKYIEWKTKGVGGDG